MKTYRIENTEIEATRIVYGCMEIGGNWSTNPINDDIKKHGLAALHAALDAGINFFDLADIYCRGKSDESFSQIWDLDADMRQKIYVQTKAGIRFPGDPNAGDPTRYDYSFTHLMASVEGSLKRLKTDYIDILLLHRPDALVEPEEVARAFDELHSSGKVRYFGVSNHFTDQIELLKHHINRPLLVNQLELNILHSGLMSAGVSVNQTFPPYPIHGAGTLEYCREHSIRIQAWSPLAKGQLTGAKVKSDEPRFRKTKELVDRLASEKGVRSEAIALAWLLRHPAGIQPVIGTTNPERIKACAAADSVDLSREEWYSLFAAGRGADMA
ncbi:MAG TPA: aldo/keto reductase [Spirochaetia bacterium]|nr:aldo/keto reductase [Spirochaetia bacterium]